MVRKELRINEIAGAISKKEMERLTRVIDSVFLKYDINKNGSLDINELGQILKGMYEDGYIDVMPTEGLVREFSG